MDVIQAITGRRNVKSFKPDPVDEQKILSWLETASYAPNHRMTEPWEIYFLGAQTREQIAHKNDFGGAPTVLAIVSTPAKSTVDRDEHLQAATCFVQNFLLAAYAEGVGTGWASIGWSPRVHEILGLGPAHEIIAILPVGYPTDWPEMKPRTEISAKVHRLP